MPFQVHQNSLLQTGDIQKAFNPTQGSCTH